MSSAPNFVTPESFELSRLRPPTELVKNDKQTNGWFNYEYPNGQTDQLQIFTDWVYLNWGLNLYKDKWSMDISTWKKEENESLMNLYKLFLVLDEATFETYHGNWETWFGVAKSKDVIREKQTTIVEEKNPGKFAPVIRVSAKTLQGESAFAFKVFDHNKQAITTVTPQTPTLLGKSTRCRVLLNGSLSWYSPAFGFGQKLFVKQVYLPKPYAGQVPSEPIMFDGPTNTDSTPIMSDN